MVTTRRVVLLSLAVSWSVVGIAGAGAGRREGLLRRQDRADDRGLRHRRRLRHLLAHDRALSLQGAGDDRHRREPAGRRRARSRSIACTWRRPTVCKSRSPTAPALPSPSSPINRGCAIDLTKFSYLATVGAPPGLWLVGPDSPDQGSPAGDRRQDEMAMGVLGRNVRARHRRRLHLRGAQARLPCRAGLQEQRRRRACGHARRDGRALRAGIVRQQFREGQAELGAGDDLAHQLALLPGPADDLRGRQDGCGRGFG